MTLPAKITERCSCGATFEVEAQYSTDATSAANAWRENHRHDAPFYIGDTPPVLPTDEHIGVRPWWDTSGTTTLSQNPEGMTVTMKEN